MATISTHNGSAVSREHNIRADYVVSKEEHIDPNGTFEIWLDEQPKAAYHRLFDAALKEYNDKQTRNDRVIDNYYNHVKKDKSKHLVYEMIVGVYGGDNVTLDEGACKSILKEFYKGWKERNPHLEMIGAYYHFDEKGKEPHLHIDYIPVATECTRSLRVQNGMKSALKQQGFVATKSKETAQIQWEHRENMVLESICADYGIVIEHPQANKGVQHLNTNQYKAQQELNKVEKVLKDKKDELNALNGKINDCEATVEFFNELNLSIKNKTPKKEPFSKEEYVKIPKSELDNIQVIPNIQEMVFERIERANKQEKEAKALKSRLEEKKLRIDELEQAAMRTKAELEAKLILEPMYHDFYKEEVSKNRELENKNIQLESTLEKITEEFADAACDLEAVKTENRKLSKQIDEQDKELSLLKKVFAPFIKAFDKIKRLFDYEQIAKEPDGELSRKNREASKLYKFNEAPEPYAEFSPLSNRWQYYWKGGNSNRDGFLEQAYLPLAREVNDEIGTIAMLDQELLSEAFDVEEKSIELSKKINRGKHI